MIQIADNLEYEESRKVPLNPRLKRVLIEIASNRNIDFAVVDAEEERAFEESPTGHEPKIDWVENVRNWTWSSSFPKRTRSTIFCSGIRTKKATRSWPTR